MSLVEYVHNQEKAQDEIHRLASQVEALGVGYTRMEQCVMELVKAMHAYTQATQHLIEQNSAILQAMAEDDGDEEEPDAGYLSAKPRKR